MAFHLGNGIWDGVFAVPNAVVDNHLKIASGLSAKVLLLLLRHQGNLEIMDIAAALGQSTTDIQDAVHYWIQAGILSPKEAPESQAETPLRYEVLPEEQPQADPTPPREQKIEILRTEKRRLSSQEINEMAQTDSTIPNLLQEAQAVLGKPLTPLSTETIVSLYSYHGMQPDLILLLMHYCVQSGKNSIRYIEQLASDWMDRGIDSYDKAEIEIVRLTRLHSIEGRIKTAFGIDRSLVHKEKKYIQTWTEDWKQDLPLITFAYERCIEMTGKLNFAYINGILSNWYQSGITTPTQAANETREHGAKKDSTAASSPHTSYDMNEVKQMIASEVI